MSEIKPGRYTARVKNYWIGKTHAGLPQAEVLFEFESEGELHELIWFGSFKDKARPHTIKALLHCGFKGSDLSALAEGPDSNTLDLGKEVQITVAKEVDDKGNPRLRIQWINPLGGAAFRERLDRGEVMRSLGGLKGDVMAVRQETGIADPDSFDSFDDGSSNENVGF